MRLGVADLERAAGAFARSRNIDPELAIRARIAVARHHYERGNGDRGLAHARLALRFARRRLGERAVVTASVHNLIGVLAKHAGRFAVAERHYRAALPVTRARFGAVSREVAIVLHNLGGIDHARGEFARGERTARRSVAIARALLSPRDPERIAHEVAHAALLDGLGRQRESIPIYRRSIAAYAAQLGPSDPEVALTLHNLASAEHALGRLVAAQRHYEAAIALFDRRHPDRALTQFNLAILHRDAGRLGRARVLFRAAHATFLRRLGAAHPSTRASVGALAALRLEPSKGAP
jgi:tetratricopeptide (TPR) repeat protein